MRVRVERLSRNALPRRVHQAARCERTTEGRLAQLGGHVTWSEPRPLSTLSERVGASDLPAGSERKEAKAETKARRIPRRGSNLVMRG